jgi:hypothetical protein
MMAIQATVPTNSGIVTDAYIRLRDHHVTVVEALDEKTAPFVAARAANTISVAQIEVYENASETSQKLPAIHVDRVKVNPLDPSIDITDDNAVLTALYDKLKDHLVGLEHASSITSLSDIEDV